MKNKRLTIIIAVSVALLFPIVMSLALYPLGLSVFSVFAAKPDISELDREQLIKLKQVYLEEMKNNEELTADDVTILEYCGTYNGCSVMMFTSRGTLYLTAIEVVNVAGINFLYSDSNKLYAYKDGKIYSLEQAYENGFLTKINIVNIRDIHNKY